MATTTNVTAKYAGNLAGEILAQAFRKSTTLDKELISVLPNVIGSGFLPSLEVSGDLQTYACGWNPDGGINYSDKEVQLKKVMFPMEICKDDFYKTFQSEAEKLWKADNDMPQSILEAILEAVVAHVGAKVEDAIWNGSVVTGNGFLTQFAADATVVKVDAPTDAITKANVEDYLNSIIDAQADEVLDSEDFILAVSKDVYGAYRRAVASQGTNNTSGADYSDLDFLGYKVEKVSALPNKAVVAYEKRNLGFLTGLVNDLNEVRIADDEARLDGQIRAKITFTMGVGYTKGSRIVYGRTAPAQG